MSIATLANIEKTFGKRVLFDRLSLTIHPGERIGLIGANGSGKTTLLGILTGRVIPDAGHVVISKTTRIGHLRQDPVFDPENTVLDEAELAFGRLHRLSQRLREIEHEMAKLSGEALEKALRRYQAAQHGFDAAGGYAWRHRLEATLDGVGLDRGTWEQNVETLSGGQRSRLALAKLLIGEPDLLLLDEPTNHLDLRAIEWLERYLLGFNGAMLLISHDRYLLDRLATRIAWLRGLRISSYPGNYSAFVKQREVEELTQRRQYQQQQEEIDKQREFIRRFGAGQRSREAKGREKRLNRLLTGDGLVERVSNEKQVRLRLGGDRRAGDRVLSARDLSKSYDGQTLWRGLRLEVQRGERIGLIGPNGSGKTTLLEVLLGQREADEGTIRWGANLNIGYYDQRLDEFDPAQTVMEAARGQRDVKEQALRDMLALMLFQGRDVEKSMGVLSGGERARVRLAHLLLDRPNVLLLDEPTNHLDIPSREALEGALSDYDGTIVCVSHDRYFLDRVVRRLLVLEPPEVRDVEGNYSDWIEQSEREASSQKPEAGLGAAKSATADEARSRGPKGRPAARKDNPYARPFGRLSLEELERQITETEIALAECHEQFGDADTFRDAQRAQEIQTEHAELSSRLEALEAEYFAREA